MRVAFLYKPQQFIKTLFLILLLNFSCKEDEEIKKQEKEDILIPEAELITDTSYVSDSIKIKIINDENSKLKGIYIDEDDMAVTGQFRVDKFIRKDGIVSFLVKDVNTTVDFTNKYHFYIRLAFEGEHEITFEWNAAEPNLISIDESILTLDKKLKIKIKGSKEGNFYIHNDFNEDIDISECSCNSLVQDKVNDSTVELSLNSNNNLLFSKVYLSYFENGRQYHLNKEIIYTSSYSIEEFPNPESVTFGAGISLDLGLNFTAITENIQVFIGDAPLTFVFYFGGSAAFEFPISNSNIEDSTLTVLFNDIPLVTDSNTKMKLKDSYFKLSQYDLNVDQDLTLEAELDHVFYQKNEKLHFENTVTNEKYIAESITANSTNNGQGMILEFNVPQEVYSNPAGYEIYITAGIQGREISEKDNKIFKVE